MPRIFDNIETSLLPALAETLKLSQRADFCVGYFNLRGWRQIDRFVDDWAGADDSRCRLLVGMQRLPHEELRSSLSLLDRNQSIDTREARRLRREAALEFRQQLTAGAPSNEDEAGLQRLKAQIQAGQLVVKLFLRYPLHAKLYLLHRTDPNNPTTGYLGSSNLTLAGLKQQGELNVDVLDHDACAKLQKWFDDRWNDRLCVDISEELVEIIDESWAREELIPPYHIYLKMAYHLSRDAREGLAEFRIPPIFGAQLFEFQAAAAQIAAHHINRRGGALIGDVVGLGKTLMATAVAKILEDDYGLETLIICPRNLTEMWKDYAHRYQLRHEVMSISVARNRLPDLRRYRIVIVDESHNLRNPEGQTYRAIREYIAANESLAVLLSATPYNKTYTDLSAQLGLFTPFDKDLGVRPERQLREMGETEFVRQHQCGLSTLAAFEHSEFADDWRELMRLYMVRRTRSFIKDHYARTDPDTGRTYLQFPDESRSYFPDRVPRTLGFAIDPGDPDDQYARMYSDHVVAVVNRLKLPRYGLGNYVDLEPENPPTPAEKKRIDDLNRAGQRLQGFCRTNLFKRLESSGPAFLQSVERHVLRNLLVLHAVERGLDVPIGAQSAEDLDTRQTDADRNAARLRFDEEDDIEATHGDGAYTEEAFQARAADAFAQIAGPRSSRYDWLRADLFKANLARDLRADARALIGLLADAGSWDPSRDAKLSRLHRLLTADHPHEKVLVFSQFADTVDYLTAQLTDGTGERSTIERLEGVTGNSKNPTAAARRFSPVSNEARDKVSPGHELRVVIATDVLSEGQNLQDCAIVVNYDLPWAIIRLAQRAGRVDRIGQSADQILCYSFLPADGVERVIRLRSRVRQRLNENAEVVGADEAYFADDEDRPVLDLYNERAGVLDGDEDTEIDLASYAFQIWKNATDDHPALRRQVENLPDVVYSARALDPSSLTTDHQPLTTASPGALIYLRTAADNDTLVRVNEDGTTVSQSHFAILNAAYCLPDTPAVPRQDGHHELVASAVRKAASEEKHVGGQLGRPSGARFRVYDRLKNHIERNRGTLFVTPELERAHEAIYRFPLREAARDTLNRQLRSGVSDETLAELVTLLHDADRLCLTQADDEPREPQIICSLGLRAPNPVGQPLFDARSSRTPAPVRAPLVGAQPPPASTPVRAPLVGARSSRTPAPVRAPLVGAQPPPASTPVGAPLVGAQSPRPPNPTPAP